MLHDRRREQEGSRSLSLGVDLRGELRRATARDHARLEAVLDLEAPDLSLERYRRVLAAFHGFYAPLEAAFRQFGPVAPALEFALPDRARWLALDLAALDATTAASGDERCDDMPSVATVADLAGCLYVLEGAALGGQVLARSVADRWGLTPGSGAAFFNGDGPRATKRRWSLVLDWLGRVASGGAPAARVVAAASATFVALERWATAQGATS